MQKVINVLAVLSFLGTASIIGGGYYLYTQKDPIIEDLTKKIVTAATETITEALPGMMDAAMPELPSTTGGAIPNIPRQ
tara:strand:- start:79 stop:315 length:237 start_codon:yes stop_codon:yes gene_type:complete